MQHRELSNLLRISRCFDSYRRRQLKDADIYPALHLVVSYVCRHPGCRQETLADELCIDKTTVAHHLSVLEEKRFIERRADERDGRCRRVYPTDRAEELFPMLKQTFEAFCEGLLGSLSPEDRLSVARLSEILFQNARKMVGFPQHDDSGDRHKP